MRARRFDQPAEVAAVIQHREHVAVGVNRNRPHAFGRDHAAVDRFIARRKLLDPIVARIGDPQVPGGVDRNAGWALQRPSTQATAERPKRLAGRRFSAGQFFGASRRNVLQYLILGHDRHVHIAFGVGRDTHHRQANSKTLFKDRGTASLFHRKRTNLRSTRRIEYVDGMPKRIERVNIAVNGADRRPTVAEREPFSDRRGRRQQVAQRAKLVHTPQEHCLFFPSTNKAAEAGRIQITTRRVRRTGRLIDGDTQRARRFELAIRDQPGGFRAGILRGRDRRVE